MRTTLLSILLLVAGLSFSFAQTVIDNFDSSAVNDVYIINLVRVLPQRVTIIQIFRREQVR